MYFGSERMHILDACSRGWIFGSVVFDQRPRHTLFQSLNDLPVFVFHVISIFSVLVKNMLRKPTVTYDIWILYKLLVGVLIALFSIFWTVRKLFTNICGSIMKIGKFISCNKSV